MTPHFIPWDPLDVPLYPKDVFLELDSLKATKSPELTYKSSEDPLNVPMGLLHVPLDPLGAPLTSPLTSQTIPFS